MKKRLLLACLVAAAPFSPAAAQQTNVQTVQPVTGTRLDITATGEVTRVPDIAIVSAGVVSRAATAGAALEETSRRMEAVRSALKRAGIADRDIQTSAINLNPDYRYQDGQAPQLTGYQATNQVTVRFRDIAASGRVIDALVAQGANQVNGPSLAIDRPEAALDEARLAALAAARARADLYARAIGQRVKRILWVSESGGSYAPPPPVPMVMNVGARVSQSRIDPGDQRVSATISASFELE
jgi:uncharacterized protein YggE